MSLSCGYLHVHVALGPCTSVDLRRIVQTDKQSLTARTSHHHSLVSPTASTKSLRTFLLFAQPHQLCLGTALSLRV
jgi:hypothetical protein